MLWVTGDWFMAHDIILVPLISKIVNIHWIIIFPQKDQRFTEDDFKEIRINNPKLQITFLYVKHRMRNPMNILDYRLIWKIQEREKSDVIHLDFGVDNIWALPLFFKLPKEKTIVVLHQGVPHLGMKHRWLCNLVRKCIFSHIKYVKMFSKSQANLFKKKFTGNKVFEFKLPLIGFGFPNSERPVGKPIRFLSFGTINYAKNVEILIDAACLLYERGVRGFKVSINGACKDWSWYQQRIKYPEIFELDIRMIENFEIPNLFNGAHYLVQPYRVVSQSGPMKIAFNYNLPDITSDLLGFTDEIVEGVNGYTFETGNAESLADKMQWVIEHHEKNYPELLKRMKKHTDENYSGEKLVQQYVDMFEDIIKHHD